MENNKISQASLILGACLIVSALIGAVAFYKVRSLDNALSVTGSAKKQITADVAKWSGSFSRIVTVDNIKGGYAQMEQDLKAVKKFFTGKGIEEKDLVISPVFMNEQYKYNATGDAPREYMLQQTVEIQSSDVVKITDLAKNTEEIIRNGVIFSPMSPEYYYSKLPEARIDLLGEAVKDARARADKIAESSGKKVGAVKSVSVGVTQVTPVNSTDITDYGTYDTSKIDKEVMITVKAAFSLK
ncbi:MAG: SIMPL domain-containing protein [Patescibacteria group bacterium]